ncbi:hypothetical protein OPT61_g3623 [Boeremia exigua]|uniref:Uncharacterized protein n=1 Tax=Boeremia exigua TaxID=749465 RepID=A0ACC2IH79_9PLEO|nr:hypothetical protein OPT61_g3623 [Boeremia exigua]
MATRVTIANNAKQSHMAPLLIPATTAQDPAAQSSIQSLIFKNARSKLKLKRPERVFVKHTGQELIDEEDWKNDIKNDIVLLVSCGEEFVGVKKEAVVHEDRNPNCPVQVLASSAPVDSLSITQLTTTAHTLPGIVHAVGQPDLHPGTKFPIGAVFVSKRWIHPPLMGGDIGCGMAWYRLTLNRDQVDGDKGKKVAEKLRGLEGPWRTQEDRELWLQDKEGSCSAGEKWDSSLGTIGAGNHFAEIQVVEEASNASHGGLHQDDVVLLVHSGSRGYGGKVLKEYTAESHAGLLEGSIGATEYLKEHDKACRWAKANRDLIALRFLACLEPGNEDWQLGISDSRSSLGIRTSIERSKQALEARKVVDIWHNNVERIKWPPSAPGSAEATTLDNSGHVQDYAYIHRKGAAPTHDPETHLPLTLLPLPGSRGTPTLILQPSFSEATSWGLKNALSLAHGAGRSMSRAKALSSLAQKYKGQDILRPRAGEAEGTWVICDEKDLVFEEAPAAYKDVQAVGQDLVDAGVATIVGWCRARVSYKRNTGAREPAPVSGPPEYFWKPSSQSLALCCGSPMFAVAYSTKKALGWTTMFLRCAALCGAAAAAMWREYTAASKALLRASHQPPIALNMRSQILSLIAAASAVAAQSSVVVPAPVVSGNPEGASYVATLPEQTKYTVRGSVAAVTADDGTGVKFTVSISGLPAEGGPFMYHIHEKPVPSDGNCTGTGAHLDPYKRGEVPICDATKPETCQTGDLSGKHGNMTAQEWSQEYVDLYSATRPDSNAYFGNLSVVVHLSNKTRIACANFTQLSAGDDESDDYPTSSINLSTGVSSGYSMPTGNGGYNSTAPSTPSGTASPTTAIPISPSSATTSAPAEFTDAAPKLVSGAAGAVVAVAAVLLL